MIRNLAIYALLLIAVAAMGVWVGRWDRPEPNFSSTGITRAILRGQEYHIIPSDLLTGRGVLIDSKAPAITFSAKRIYSSSARS